MAEKRSLKQICEEKEYSQQRLSNRTGISVRTIQDYQQGRRKLSHAKAETVRKIAQALNCTMEELLDGEREKEGNG